MPSCCPPGDYCPMHRALAIRAGVIIDAPPVPLTVYKLVSAPEDIPVVWLRDIPERLPASTTEEELRALIRKVAIPHGWKHYHPWNSEKSEPGWPDDCLARPRSSTSTGRLILAELKSAKGKLTSEQAIWLDVLRHTIPHLEVYVWRPADITDIVDILTRK